MARADVRVTKSRGLRTAGFFNYLHWTVRPDSKIVHEWALINLASKPLFRALVAGLRRRETWPPLNKCASAGTHGVSEAAGEVGWGRWKRRVSRWLMAGGQPAPPRHRQPHPLRVAVVHFAPEGGWAFLPYPCASWHLGSSLVPPRDPQSQTTVPAPSPRAQEGLL